MTKKKKGTKTPQSSQKKTGSRKRVNKPGPQLTGKQPEKKESLAEFPIVGIGASAGGLEAIEGFFGNMPQDTNIAFVVIQHLAPKHKSIMPELLKKHTSMRIFVVEDGMKVEPNCMYLNPPDRDVAVMNQVFHLISPQESQHVRLPIDFFFRSLADEMGDKAICIVLSGTGTDGTLGLKAIKGEGGMTMVQDAIQAKYDGMPRSAISTGLVDFVLPVEKMPGELLKYAKHPYIKSRETDLTPRQDLINTLNKIFFLVRSETGHDFSNYKHNTIRRRIERRMAVHQIETIGKYLRYLQQNTEEVKALDRDMLIGVTNFFRDPAAFEALEKKALPSLLENRTTKAPLRIWTTGCATGEEAYSLAIMFLEAMERLKKHFKIQIFATDIDAEAVESARSGVYPESIAADVSAGRLERFFIKEDSVYKINKQIRDMVVFAVHDLTKDPPFSKLDLVSCRNVMIYMDQVLQKKILPIFHYSLNRGGFLFLGTSESVGGFSDLFSSGDPKWKIFQRKGDLPERAAEYPAMPYAYPLAGMERTDKKVLRESEIRQMAEKIILEKYSPSSVLINNKYEILYFFGSTERFLTPPAGEPSFSILKMAREDLRYQLSIALHKALKQKKTVVTEGLQIKDDGGLLNVDIVVMPLKENASMGGMTMVIFDAEKTHRKTTAGKGRKHAGAEDPRFTALEQELKSVREYLQTTIEELETSNEELKSTNEELQSTNEELQSSNEELETSKEEMQSTNEELETINAELQDKLNELKRANDDLSNLLAGTEIGTIFLDRDLCIKRFTPSLTNIFNLIQTDVGRPISDITSKIVYAGVNDDANEVLRTLIRKETVIQTRDGEWFSMNILPYRTLENVIDGVVLTFSNITVVKKKEAEAEEARAFAESIVETVREPLIVLDAEQRVMSANRSFYRMFHVRPEDTVNRIIYDLGNHQWDIPELRKLLNEILPENSTVEDFGVRHDFPEIGPKVMLLNARRIFNKKSGTQMVLLAIEDVTEK
ncbi:MAG: PAS domain-containing protein [Nitrospiraceae bacterium]|nr:MAG: PAS domain-containing protein [Nitrospiraceae bacterium]